MMFRPSIKFPHGIKYCKCLELFSLQSRLVGSFVELTDEMKFKIESKWRANICKGLYKPNDITSRKRYVLSMFPYPSGNLHLGHMRVYTIGDTMSWYYRLRGDNVFQPIGFDAFGLPAENAAFERNLPADKWTYSNIETMREQFKKIGYSFDWDNEVITCHPSYYKFTQYLFLLMFEEGLVYQDEAVVNWDPVDKTVLANEQVDVDGRSWRSGALVEKRFLNQWFIETTRFAYNLSDSLDRSNLEEWKDIIALQKHWLGICDGSLFKFAVSKDNEIISHIKIWTRYPEFIKNCSFLAISPSNILNKMYGCNNIKLDIELLNPFGGPKLPIVVCENIDYDAGTDMKLINPSVDELDLHFANQFNLIWRPVEEIKEDLVERERICELARIAGIGGYRVSSKLKDWPISRQRRWGTPIPLIHCRSCGIVPVPKEQLPVTLPVGDIESWSKTLCPKCGKEAKRETDTMDTFVDSSWYFLRYLDPKNDSLPFNQEIADHMMPVDLYIGGKEHATLHLYYARFFSHFLHSIGLLKEPEPFKMLLVQGMVMGKTYKVKDSGKYLKESQVSICNGKAVESKSGLPVEETWEKMSKSKHNGIEPVDLLDKYGIDTTRLFMLSDVSPQSHKYWKCENFPGILNWQKRIWALMQDFTSARVSLKGAVDKKDSKMEQSLWESRNHFIKTVSFSYRHSFQLSAAISRLQAFTNTLKKCPKECIALSSEFEKCLAALIIMLAPMAPHYASELWDNFKHLPRRINISSCDIRWDKSLFNQTWPIMDDDYNLKLYFSVNKAVKDTVLLPYNAFREINHDTAVEMGLKSTKVKNFIGPCDILKTHLNVVSDFEAYLNIEINHLQKRTEKYLKEKMV